MRSDVGLRIARCDLGATNAWLEHARDSGRDPILQLEYIGHDAVVPVGPDMVAGLGFDQLARDAQLPERPAHAAFKNVTDAEPPSDVADIHALALEGEGRVARDHEQGTEARKAVVISSTIPSANHSVSGS